MSSPEQVIRRWDAGIADILARFDAILQQAVTASEPLINAVEMDLTPVTRPWMVIQNQMHEFTEEVSNKWDEISNELSDLDDLEEGIMDREGQKRDLTTCEIEIRFQRANLDVMARAAGRMREKALAKDACERRCTQCGAPMDKIKPVSLALNVECGYCSSMNTIEPSSALRMFAAGGSMYLGQKAGFEHWEEMTRSETRINQYRNNKDVPLQLLETYADSARQYWTTRLGVEAGYVPEDQKYLETRLERYLKDAEKKLRQYWQWRQRKT